MFPKTRTLHKYLIESNKNNFQELQIKIWIQKEDLI